MTRENFMTKEQIISDDITNPMNRIDANKISDWYHTFGELYKHRIHLFIALCKSLNNNYTIIKSKKHHDWTSMDWWFIIQINHSYVWQISYHLPMEYWDKCKFILSLPEADEWDWHTSDDVLERLLKI